MISQNTCVNTAPIKNFMMCRQAWVSTAEKIIDQRIFFVGRYLANFIQPTTQKC